MWQCNTLLSDRAELYGFVDVDEFFEFGGWTNDEFWSRFEELDVAYFENEWNFLPAAINVGRPD